MIFTAKIITPQDLLVIQDALCVVLQTINGQEGILAKHQMDSYELQAGICTVRSGEKGDMVERFKLSDGIAKFEHNVLEIVVVLMERYAQSIDENVNR